MGEFQKHFLLDDFERNIFIFTVIFPVWKASISERRVFKLIFGGMNPSSKASTTLVTEHKPEPGSEWPMFDLTEPILRGVVRPGQNTASNVLTSSGSPT